MNPPRRLATEPSCPTCRAISAGRHTRRRHGSLAACRQRGWKASVELRISHAGHLVWTGLIPNRSGDQARRTRTILDGKLRQSEPRSPRGAARFGSSTDARAKTGAHNGILAETFPRRLERGSIVDTDRFDLLTRALVPSSRRGVSRALAGLGLMGGLGLRLGGPATEARKGRKNKRKCKKSQRKCGKTCIPKDGCCPACGSRETCSFGFCICAPGTTDCGELCCVNGAEVCLRETAPDGTLQFRCLPTG